MTGWAAPRDVEDDTPGHMRVAPVRRSERGFFYPAIAALSLTLIRISSPHPKAISQTLRRLEVRVVVSLKQLNQLVGVRLETLRKRPTDGFENPTVCHGRRAVRASLRTSASL